MGAPSGLRPETEEAGRASVSGSPDTQNKTQISIKDSNAITYAKRSGYCVFHPERIGTVCSGLWPPAHLACRPSIVPLMARSPSKNSLRCENPAGAFHLLEKDAEYGKDSSFEV
jgi:hypothetical protein